MERRVRFVQPLVIRVSHWLNAIVLLGMIASGLQIFGAYPAFAERGGAFCCYPFAGVRFPEAVRLGGWLAGGLKWHLFLVWPFVLNGLVWVGYLLGSGEWRRRLFRPRDARGAWEMALYYARLRREKPAYEIYNGLQRLAYTETLLLGRGSLRSAGWCAAPSCSHSPIWSGCPARRSGFATTASKDGPRSSILSRWSRTA